MKAAKNYAFGEKCTLALDTYIIAAFPFQDPFNCFSIDYLYI